MRDRLRPKGRTIRFNPPEVSTTKRLCKSIDVDASIGEVWKAWTTAKGASRFFAPSARIELEVGGPYEPLFDLDSPAGLQGGEGLQVLGYVPNETLSFTWNAPPHFPSIRRNYHTWVVLQFEPLSRNRTRVRLDHLGWGKGGDWPKVYSYFDRAWDLVLWRLAERFNRGPIDWDEPYSPPKGWSASVCEQR
jgi:uncharacterized protein YndB with AHSA1/START domain